MNIEGNRNVVHNSFANDNVNGGIAVKGDGNTIDTVQTSRNSAGYGLSVVGNGNTIANGTAVDNGAAGIRVGGTGNLITGNNASRNILDGIGVSGGTAVSPNVVSSNVGGTAGSGNGRAGISLTGTGSGAGGVADIKGNTTRGNASDGIQVTGSGHKLKNNSSGGSGSDRNHVCQYRVASGNINESGNTMGSVPIPGANGSPFPGCL
jgi:hypothetical protein